MNPIQSRYLMIRPLAMWGSLLVRYKKATSENMPIFTTSFIDTVCRIAVVYLTIPIFLFLFFWFKWLFAVLAITILFYALRPIFKENITGKLFQTNIAQTAIIVFSFLASAAFCIVNFASYDSIPFADALKHKSILNDLAKESWPVVYLESESGFTILRYSFAYYLLPAGISKITGVESLNYWLVFWTAGGVFLFFMMAVGSAKKIYSAYLSIFTASLFSGLSVIIVLATNEANSNVWYSTFNAWARPWGNSWLIGSHPFELGWCAQHALPAWLGAGIIYYCHNEQWFKKITGVVTAILLLWSPFVAFSFATLLGLVWITDNARKMRFNLLGLLKEKFFEVLTVRNIAAIILVVWILWFITIDSQKIPVDFFVIRKPWEIFISQYLIFITIEFGMLLMAIKYTSIPFDRLIICATMILLMLLFTSVGANSDLQMRGSQLPFTILMFFALSALRQPASHSAKAILSIVIFIGLVGGYQEIHRKPITKINLDNKKSELPLPFASFGPGDENIKPQYLANISKSSLLFAKPRSSEVYVINPVAINLYQDFHTSEKGDFSERERIVESLEFTDAALVSDEVIPAGLYRLDAVLDWDVVAENELVNAAHISLHGYRLLVPIKSSKGINKRVSTYFQFDGKAAKISFGLGGWAKGKGFIKLKELTISSVTKHALND